MSKEILQMIKVCWTKHEFGHDAVRHEAIGWAVYPESPGWSRRGFNNDEYLRIATCIKNCETSTDVRLVPRDDIESIVNLYESKEPEEGISINQDKIELSKRWFEDTCERIQSLELHGFRVTGISLTVDRQQ